MGKVEVFESLTILSIAINCICPDYSLVRDTRLFLFLHQFDTFGTVTSEAGVLAFGQVAAKCSVLIFRNNFSSINVVPFVAISFGKLTCAHCSMYGILFPTISWSQLFETTCWKIFPTFIQVSFALLLALSPDIDT